MIPYFITNATVDDWITMKNCNRHFKEHIHAYIYCILHEQIKGYNSSVSNIVCQEGSGRTFLSKKTICSFNKCVDIVLNFKEK